MNKDTNIIAYTFLGTVGYHVDLELGIPVTADTVKIKYTKPDGVTTGTWTATPLVEASGLIRYDTLVDDLDVLGEWIIQGNYDPAGTSIFWGDEVRLIVQ